MGNEIIEKENLPPGTIGLEFRIERVDYFPHTRERACKILLHLKCISKEHNCTYSLFGNHIKKDFLSEMGVDFPDGLVKKTITGYFNERRLGIQGLSVLE